MNMGRLAAIAGLLLAALVVLGGVGYGFGYIGYRNTANAFEIDIAAQYTNMQNVYDNGWKKVVEVAQIPAMQADNYKKVYADVMTGRYGAGGSKAFVQFIKEQNPNLDASLYDKIGQTIEVFHDGFQASQTDLIARKQAYGRFVTASTDSIFYNWIGHYPHIRCGIPIGAADDYQIITSGKTQNDFQKHQAAPLDLSKGTNQ